MNMSVNYAWFDGAVPRLCRLLAIICFSIPSFAQMISAAHAQNDSITVRIAWGTYPNTPITATMKEDKLFEKYAKKAGYNITTEWIEFVSGPAVNEAVASGRIDIDIGYTTFPIASRLGAGVKSFPIAVETSHISNAILVSPNGPVRSVADLRGRTVGTLIGTAGHYLLASVVKYELGQSLSEAGIRIVNVPPGDGIKIPPGIDAYVIWMPFRYLGPSSGRSALLVDADGKFGTGSDRPGTRSEQVKKAWAYPEGYCADVLFDSVTEAFATKYPDLVTAFLLARWEAQDEVLADQARAIAVAKPYWKLPDDVAKEVLETTAETGGARSFPFLTEGDALALLKTSEFMA